MYFPYMRSKQYELITIREQAPLLKERGFVPIIEPVKASLNGLERTLREIRDVGGKCVLIVNPIKGDHCEDSAAVEELLSSDEFEDFPGLSIGVLACSGADPKVIKKLCNRTDKDVSLVHWDFTDGKLLAETVKACPRLIRHIFLEPTCSKLYRKHYPDKERILLRDGFQKRLNRQYPPLESFSDLHATFPDEGMNGFGDFLMVGSDYNETGGPAYAIAIHLTFIDGSKDDEMFISHFISDRTDTPSDPAGKFLEALRKLVREVNKSGSPISKTDAVSEYLTLYKDKHFPGLGYVKKLSMQHHIETLAEYFEGK